MLQSSNQYLRPDYLASSTALDTKSSPLALLAQTCSAIGADTTNPKLLAANIEKSTKSLKTATDARDKGSPLSSHSSSVSTGSAEHQQIKSSFKPYESTCDRLKEEADRAGSQPHNHSSQRVKSQSSVCGQLNDQQQQHQQQPSQQRSDSNQSAASQGDSPAVATMSGQRRTPSAAAMDQQHLRVNSPVHALSKDSSANQAAVPQSSPSAASLRLQAASDSALAGAKEANYAKALQIAAAGGIPTSSASSATGGAYYGYPGTSSVMPYPMDLMTASALMSPHNAMFKSVAMHPYLNYARLKGIDASTAAAMMAPSICRDPYCSGCPSSPHFLNKAAGQPCPAGCPQCDSGKPSAVGGSSSSAAASAAAAASSYHAQLAALAAASQFPYMCSWIGSDAAYCGKRFGTSEELFQHLRTHTASMPDSVLSAAAAGGIPLNHPLFQRTYPTPPLSPLSASRYHPYSKPSMLPPSLVPPGSLAGLPMPPHTALTHYFSPYSLYGGPRMGSSHP